MSTKTFCDRCDKPVEGKHYSLYIEERNSPIFRYDDLCETCYNEIIKNL